MRLSKLIHGVLLTAAMARSQEVGVPQYRGLVTFHGLPVPGATVTVTQAGKKTVTVTDTQGFYSLGGLAIGAATLDVQMTGFAKSEEAVTVAAETVLGKVELQLMSLDEMRAALKPVASAAITVVQARSEVQRTGDAPKPAANAAAPAPPSEEVAQRAAEGLLINGSVNNAATSQFSLAPHFGNTVSGKGLYSFSLNVRVDNSALDARSYSLSGFNTSKPQTNALTGGFSIQGPIKIPHLLKKGPNLFVGYQRVQNSISISTPGLVPTLAERGGDLSQLAVGQVIYAPASISAACMQAGVKPGMPLAGNVIPAACISPQATALFNLYPLPNIAGNPQYNYQVPLVTNTHVDSVNSNVNKTIGRKNQVNGTLAATSVRNSGTNLLGFTDAKSSLGINTSVNWNHTFNAHWHTNVGYQFSRQSTRSTPYWQTRANPSVAAGIMGNDQDAPYGGPPNLVFSSGTAGLTDAQASFLRNATSGVSFKVQWNRSSHNLTAGADFRRQQFNYLSQANPRGTFTFTGTATANQSAPGTGSDVADFLLGVPDASSISFGNADKYLRQTAGDLYLTDDWRVNPQLTINAGARYEYGAPVTEVKQRLANIDVAGNFSAVMPVLASTPHGPLSGQQLPGSLLRPDRTALEPRIGVSYRPLPGSSLVVTAGYGVTYDTSAYQGIGLNFAQQAPFAKTFTVANGPGCPLTLANGFNCPSTQTFGVDPDFRVGYVQTWNVSARRDLPASFQLQVTYLGNKGTRGVQEFLPNTNPPGTPLNPGLPTGFEYLGSGGNSTRESGQIQLRRRLKSGLTASLLYTYSKSIDDNSSFGGGGAATAGAATIAQDWTNLRGERGLSTFDQRHLLDSSLQYTTGMGKGGGALLTGWRGRVYKEWTVQLQYLAGSGLPETPLESAVVVAGYTSFVRPNVTGAGLYVAPASPTGSHLNPAAYTPAPSGQWGNARRDSITGPNQLTLNAGLLRTFRLPEKLSLDLQIYALNALNHVTFANYITNVNSLQFGLPGSANAMRTLQTSLRLRY